MSKKTKKVKSMDMGEWKLPTRWDEVTLGQFAKLEKLYRGEASKGVDPIDLVSIMSGHSRDEVISLPIDFMETMVIHLVFLETQPKMDGPKDRVEIDGETYIVNVKEKMRFGEYVDFDQLVKNDPYDYPSMFAMICRKEGELYDSDFIANEFKRRVDMFSRQPVTKMLPLVAFFFGVIHDLERTFPKLFSGQGSVKPRSADFRRFCKAYGWQRIAYVLADEKIQDVEKINQSYLTDIFFYMTYLGDKSIADEAEDKFQEGLRKAKKH